MRISDWSSDVCSSDLLFVIIGDDAAFGGQLVRALGQPQPVANIIARIDRAVEFGEGARGVNPGRLAAAGADIVANPFAPRFLEFGADIVEPRADNVPGQGPRPTLRAHPHPPTENRQS